MAQLDRLWMKLKLFLTRKRFRNELDEEMAFHRAEAEREHIAAGMSPDQARYAAAREFGNAPKLRGQSEEIVGFRAETVAQDLGFALRQLRKNPAFGLMSILILALGIGVSVAIFGFVDAALIQPLPYQASDRLLDVAESGSAFPRSNLSRDDFDDWKRMNTSLSSLEAYTGTGYLLRMGSVTEPVPAERVSDGFFRTLGVKPILGRDFLPGEDRPGQAKVVLLPYATWQKRFGSRPEVVGQSVSLSGAAYTIVGVLPREFSFAPRGNAEFWTPLQEKNECEQRRSCHNLYGVGRLRDSITLQTATEDLKHIAAQLEKQYPGSNQGQSAHIQLLQELVVGHIRPILLTLLSGAVLLLLIACVNVASLLLVRSEGRQREIAVRGALGAAPARLMRQFVTEGALLAAAGCGAGLLLALWLMSLLTHLVPKSMAQGLPFLASVGLNTHTAVFAATVTLLAVALLAGTPMLRLGRQDMQSALSEGGRGTASRFWNRLGANLVVAELVVAVVLLTGAGLLGKSFYKLLHIDTGFDTSHLALARIMAPDSIYTKDEQKIALYREIERKVSALPGVVSVGITSDPPLQCNCNTDWIRIAGKPFHGEHNEVNERDVSPAYLQALRAKLVRGRMFEDSDDSSRPAVTVINETLARRYFPGEDPIGKMIGNGSLDPKSMRQIVGVIRDVREGAPDEDLWPSEYLSLYRSTDNGFVVLARTAQDEKTLLPPLVSTLHSIDPNLGVYDEQTMQQQMESTQGALLHRFSTWLVGGFAAAALLLSVIGLYGVVAYSVSQRTREIGVRMALGAQRSEVYAMVMRQAGWLTASGVLLGFVCSIGASLLMRKLLFGVQAWDASTLLGVGIALALASLLASFLPARRAASINPTEALRAE